MVAIHADYQRAGGQNDPITGGTQRPVVLEIGFGMGEATAHIAATLPGTDFLCCEVHEPGVGELAGQDADGAAVQPRRGRELRAGCGAAQMHHAQHLRAVVPSHLVLTRHRDIPVACTRLRRHIGLLAGGSGRQTRPVDAARFEDLREAMGKLRLNDASFSYEMETSAALGFGFRCGFLGLLHMDIVQERLEREYDMDLITTAPTVIYQGQILVESCAIMQLILDREGKGRLIPPANTVAGSRR